MRAFAFLSSIGLLLILSLTGCAAQTSPAVPQAFEFSSGGAYHFEGFGEWQISLDRQGELNIAHNVRGDVTNYGVFPLSEAETAHIWAQIEAADLRNLKPARETGLPDEVQYIFVLKDGDTTQEVKVWVGEAQQIPEIAALVESIGALIEKYTQQKPVLR
ncbi:MAG: hypothetical protein GXP40_02705 [Chloroflexi bacterium]|nr:hypothetical protein [Chloroflexota bacterium]